MSDTVSDYLLKRLHDWGVRRIYGYPGDGINGIMGALGRAQNSDAFDMEFIQTRHEEMAAFMACAHAKFTGEVGICLATSGPGAIHLLNGLYDAKMDHQGVVAIIGQQALASLGGDYQQEVDLQNLFKDVAHEYVHMCSTPVQLRHQIDRAMRIAASMHEPTCIIIPNDVQEMAAVEQPPHAHATIHSSIGYSKPHIVPKEDDLDRAARVLNECERIAILVGQGALGAKTEVREIMNHLGAGVAKALLGKAVLPDDEPGVTGAIGLLGTRASWDLMNNCDGLLMIGTNFMYPEFLPKPGQARSVQIDLDARRLGIRHCTEVNLHGDARDTILALMPKLHRKDRSWRNKVDKWIDRSRAEIIAKAEQPAEPINPQLLFERLTPYLPDNAIITADSGSAANWFARNLHVREGMMASLSGNLATMGPGVPYAIAAKFAFPDRVSIALVGDGAMQMNGINGLITISHYWRAWQNPRLVVLVLNNQDLNQVTWEQRVMSGDPKFEGSQILPAFDYADFARKLGLDGIRVEQPDQIDAAWQQAMDADRPVVVDALTDPEVPPLPPHITADQAKGFLSSVIHDPSRSAVMRQSFRAMRAKLTAGSHA